MSQRDVLLKIKREFAESESIALLLKRISELEIELGALKSELSEKEHRLKQYDNGEGKPAKDWLQDDYINNLKKYLKKFEKDAKHYKKLSEEWALKYFELSQSKNK